MEALEEHPCHGVGDGKCGELARTALRPLQKFCPIVADGVIRVGGRLQRSNLPEDFKDLIVLPKRHHVTGLIISDAHGAGGHLASQYVANKLITLSHTWSR